jgi:hypothetical protein
MGLSRDDPIEKGKRRKRREKGKKDDLRGI